MSHLVITHWPGRCPPSLLLACRRRRHPKNSDNNYDIYNNKKPRSGPRNRQDPIFRKIVDWEHQTSRNDEPKKTGEHHTSPQRNRFGIPIGQVSNRIPFNRPISSDDCLRNFRNLRSTGQSVPTPIPPSKLAIRSN